MTGTDSLIEARDTEVLEEVAIFLRRRAQYLVEGFYPDWNHVRWLRESAARLEDLAKGTND